MLLKCCQSAPSERKVKMNANKMQRNCTGNSMKLTVAPRTQRKVARAGSKRPAPGKRIILPAGPPEYQTTDPCDSSNDSGLGLEHHVELPRPSARLWCTDVGVPAKRKKLEIKQESDDANDNFTFEETINQAKRSPLEMQLLMPVLERVSAPRPSAHRVTVRRPALTAVQRRVGPALQLLAATKPHLQILSQPEQQHRARYQTEGSRGAVKDRTGNGFPTVKLVGYEGQAVLQVFIGSDLGRVVPHMFYQACRVSGKNSTPCTEKNVDGTVVIEVEFEPSKDNVITCDCVGILKERNVDVEHRFPEQSGPRNKKKSTRCRMVFRTVITHPDGTEETLEISSQPIVCTQPPGIPEICKKSLVSSPCTGGQELFILGKNFLKDSRVVFSTCESQPQLPLWEVAVQPDKEYLQQSHLVCVVPPYRDVDLTDPVTVRLSIVSSGKTSESHSFRYMPQHHQVGTAQETHCSVTQVQSGSKQLSAEQHGIVGASPIASPTILRPINTQYLLVQSAQGGKESMFLWKPTPCVKDMKLQKKLLPSPPLGALPLQPSPNSSNSILAASSEELAGQLLSSGTEELHSPILSSALKVVPCVKQVANPSPCEISETLPPTLAPLSFTTAPQPMATGADLSSTRSPSMATLRRFVSAEHVDWALPSLNVEKFLSGLEHKSQLTLESKLEEARKTFSNNTLLVASNTPLHSSSTSIPNCAEKIKFEPPSSPTSIVPSLLLRPSEIRIDTATHHENENSSSHSSPVRMSSSVVPSFSDHIVSMDQGAMMLHCHTSPTSHEAAPTAICNSLASSQITAVQNARLDALVSSAMTSTANTERLEALVNSAADCHLSPVECPPSYELIPGSHFAGEMLMDSKKDVLALGATLVNGCSLESQNVILNTHSPCIPTQQLSENIFRAESLPICNMSLGVPPLESVSPARRESIHMVPPGYPATNFHNTSSIVSESLILPSGDVTYNSSAPLVINSHVDQQLISAESNRLAALVNTSLDNHLLPTVTQMSAQENLCPLTVNVSALETDCGNVNNLFSGRNEASFIAEASTLNEPCCSNSLGLHFSVASDGAPCTTSGMHCSTSNLIMSLKEKTDALTTTVKLQSEVVAKNEGLQKREEGMVPRELTQMSENDLLSYINPSCFDTV